MKKLFILIFLYSSQIFAQYITINEFMSKNGNSIVDEDNEYNDWIELHNNHSDTISLKNYSLSDNEDDPNKWQLPDINISPKNTILIFASGKNRIHSNELHTNFKISSKGENLYLFDSQEILIDYISAVNIGEDDSFGRLPDGSNNLIHLESPSPGNSNNNTSQLIFSKNGGFFNQAFNLNVQSLFGDTIYYTLDGSIPTLNSNILEDSILIYNRNSEPNYFSEFTTSPDQSLISYKAWEPPSTIIDKANIIRCVSIKDGIPTSKVYTNTYFVDEHISTKYHLPVISLVTDETNLFDSDSGIYVPGIHFDINNPDWTGNYHQSGIEWEKPIHIEYFEKNGDLGFSQNAGIRIHGGKTRVAAQKSLRLYARNEYDKKHFNYPLLNDKENTEYKRFLLRTTMGSWHDQSIIKDILAHDIASNLSIETQDFQPTIVFMNGEYWGVHTLRDRIDENYLNYEFNINKDSIDLIGGNYNLIFAGNNSHYKNLIEFIESNDISELSNYEFVKTQIDIDNYINYQIAEMFFANFDWPENNMKLWKPQTENGKWRWIFYDLDAGLNNVDYNMFLHCTNTNESITWPNSPRSTFLFRNLLKNSDFVNQFVTRYAEILNSNFSTSSILYKADSIKQIYQNEIESHINRWHFPDNYSKWETDIEEKLIRFLENRPCTVQEHISNFLSPESFYFDCKKNEEMFNLTVAPNPNNGNFYIMNNYDQTIRGNLVIWSITGRKIYEENYIYLNAFEKKYISLPNLSIGLYLLNYSNSISSEKIVFSILN